jgi:hypothetical protein
VLALLVDRHEVEQGHPLVAPGGDALQGVGRTGDAVRPEHQPDEGEPLEEPLAYLLGHAAAHGGKDRGVALDMRGDPPQLAVDLLFRLVADAAGVDDVDQGLVLVRLFPSPALQGTGEPLRIMDIHLTPEGGDVKFH